jgi:hypothetical protein
MTKPVNTPDDRAETAVFTDVRLPLENIEYTIEQYLLTNGTWLDTETRFLLAGVRDSVRQVAGRTRMMSPPL